MFSSETSQNERSDISTLKMSQIIFALFLEKLIVVNVGAVVFENVNLAICCETILKTVHRQKDDFDQFLHRAQPRLLGGGCRSTFGFKRSVAGVSAERFCTCGHKWP